MIHAVHELLFLLYKNIWYLLQNHTNGRGWGETIMNQYKHSLSKMSFILLQTKQRESGE